MAGSTALVATLAGSLSSETFREIPDAVTILQVREDLTGRLPAAWLRNHFHGKLLYSWPRVEHNSHFSASLPARHGALIHAAKEFDLVELDGDCDLVPEVLAAIAAQQRLISWNGSTQNLSHLHSIFDRISSVPARFYSIMVHGSRTIDGLNPLLLLKELRRNDVTAICNGKAGFWSRILAPHFGAPLLFGRFDDESLSDSGEPAIHQLINDYGFPELHPVREIYGLVGNRIFQSPSPRLHNAGYRRLGHPALYIPFHVECFEDFWREVISAAALEGLGLSLKGLTIVSPYKEAALAAAALHSPVARRAGASNLFVRKNGCWEAHTTDPESVAEVAFNGHRPASPFRAAIIGCGGAGRAIAAALQQSGADVTLVNRSHERGELAVKLLSLPFVPLSHFDPAGFSLLVNATPVGRDDDSLPFSIDALDSSTTVVDLAYGTRPTPLASGVVARGSCVIDGYDVLVAQVRKQFQMMTRRPLPADVGKHIAVSRNSVKSQNGTRAVSPAKCNPVGFDTLFQPGVNIAKA